MVVKDALDISHCRLGGDKEDGLTEAYDEDGDGNAEPEPGDAAQSRGTLLHTVSLSRIGSFSVEDCLKEQNADCGEDDVVTGKLFDPCADLNRI
jgi:hypothetical protein